MRERLPSERCRSRQVVRAVSGAGLEAALPLAVKPLAKDGETSSGASSNLGRSNEIPAGVREWAATAGPSLMARTRHDGRDVDRTEQHVTLLGGSTFASAGPAYQVSVNSMPFGRRQTTILSRSDGRHSIVADIPPAAVFCLSTVQSSRDGSLAARVNRGRTTRSAHHGELAAGIGRLHSEVQE